VMRCCDVMRCASQQRPNHFILHLGERHWYTTQQVPND